MSLSDLVTDSGDMFSRLKAIADAAQFGDDDDIADAREAIVRLLASPRLLVGYEPLVNDLLATVGLYPYLEMDALDGRTAMQHALYESPLEGRVFHEVQARVYYLLYDGHNVVLSAPTSFGKSAIIDALLVAGRFDRLAIVVPTIALIDETRRRLARLPHDYSVVTQPSQQFGERFVAVMTQERILELPEDLRLDFFAVDEFYKLDDAGDRSRSELLNVAFYRLWETGAQFYLLGPNVDTIADVPRLDAQFIKTDFRTVAANYLDAPGGEDDEERLWRLIPELDGPSLIYTQSPNQARGVAEIVSAASQEDFGKPGSDLTSLLAWLSREYDDAWSVVGNLRHGVGVHHGRLPRSLAMKMVELFDNGEIPFLVCTSTLIEGVNTAAKNVVIYSNQVATRRFDFFTFNNIAGRSGRMRQYFVGNVYLFNPPPEPTLPSIDLPVLTQDDDASDSLLLQVDGEDLKERARNRMERWLSQDDLPVDVLRSSPGVDPEIQVEIASRMKAMSRREWQTLSWRGMPSRDQRDAATQLVFRSVTPRGSSAVRSLAQLNFLLYRLQATASFGDFVKERIAERREIDSIDDVIENTLEFLRNWAGFHIPRALRVLERIQHAVASQRGGPEANYGFYAGRVESFFEPQAAVALDEYGVPVQIGSRIIRQLGLGEMTFDEVIRTLRQRREDVLSILDPIERVVVLSALRDL